MKILEINKFHYLRGGSERYFFALQKILKSKGHRVAVFSMKGDSNLPSKYDDYFIEAVDLNKFSIRDVIKFFYNRDAVKKLERIIALERPDIAHLHNIAHQFSPAIISVLKKRGIPIVQTLHDYKLICPNAMLYSRNRVCEECHGKKYYHCLLRRCLKESYLKSLMATIEAYWYNRIKRTYDSVDFFIAPSNYMKEACVRFGVPEKKIKVAYNFLDFKEFENLPPTTDGGYILFYGRLSAEKGIDTVLEALSKMKGKVKFKIAGAGPDYKRLSEKITRLNLVGEAELIGPKYGIELKELVSGAKAVVLPSLWPENMPYVLLETMASGKTAIVARSGGMPELIRDKENGFLFSAGDSSGLAKVVDGLSDYDLTEIGKRAKKSIECLNANSHYKQIINLFLELKKGA